MYAMRRSAWMVTFAVGLGVANGQAERLYWSSAVNDRIQRSDLDGSSIENLVTPPFDVGWGIAFDPVTGRVFWTDHRQAHIVSAATDGSDIQVVICHDLDEPWHVATADGKLYWADRGRGTIRRADLDGSDVETIHAAPGSGTAGLVIDADAGRLYWTEANTGRVQRADLDGGNLHQVITQGLVEPVAIDLDLVNGRLYLADGSTIKRANLDGTELVTIISNIFPATVVADPVRNRIYWSEPNDDAVRSADLDGVDAGFVVVTAVGPDFVLDDTGEVMWAMFHSGIKRIEIDGPLVQTVVDAATPTPPGLAVDAAARKMYWSDNRIDAILRADLDGSNVETVRDGQPSAGPLAVDGVRGKLYWYDGSVDQIRRTNLDGTALEVVLAGANSIQDIALAPPDEATLFWAAGFGDRVAWFDLDQRQGGTLVTTGEFVDSIAVDPLAGQVYWTERFGDRIGRVNFDGTGAETFMEVDGPRRLDIDPVDRVVYFASGGAIWRVGMDLTGLAVLTDKLWPVALAVGPELVDADLDDNGVVAVEDLEAMFSVWGPCPCGEPCPADLDHDRRVGIRDFLSLLALWD